MSETPNVITEMVAVLGVATIVVEIEAKFIQRDNVAIGWEETKNLQNGVLRKLKHIFPNTYQRIKGICSPAKGGTGCYRFNYQPGS